MMTQSKSGSPTLRRARGLYGLAFDALAAMFAARIVVAVVAAVWIGLAAIPQAVDSLITLAQENRPWAWAGLMGSTTWLAINAWFWSRVALSAYRLPGIGRHPWLSETISRGIGAAAFLAVANALLRAAAAVPADMTKTMGADTSGAAPLRKAAFVLVLAGLAFIAATAPTVRHRLRMGRLPARLVLAVTLAIAVLGMGLYGSSPLFAARLLPPAPTILFAAAGLICGGVALARFGAQRHVPLLAMLLAGTIALALLRDWNVLADNHDLQRLPGPARGRPDISEAFGQFLAADDGNAGDINVVLVAAGGGGLAAADFTSIVLGDLADASPAFARHIFAISGVSGGALGATEFVLALKSMEAHQTHRRCLQGDTLRACLQHALAADFLGPATGVMLYSDLLQRFLPPVVFPDREAAIETAWAASWQNTFGNDLLRAPFLDAWPAKRPWPALFLNGTSARTGGRLATSNLKLGNSLSADGIDLLTMLDGELTASSAIGTSSRFPYFSPLGAIRRTPSAPIADWVADGGYFESLGATTLLDVLDELVRLAPTAKRHVRFVVIEIISDPSVGRASIDSTEPKRLWLPRGLVGPGAVLLHSRDARGAYAAEALARRVLALHGIYVPVRLGQSPTGATAPLGWSLSPLARRLIDAQWSPACREMILNAAGFSTSVQALRPTNVDTVLELGTMWRTQGCQVVGDPRH